MPTPFDLSVTDELLSTTRAVRRRLDLDRPVEHDVILDCIRLSQQAPTGGNQQGWAWVVVTDPEKRQALAELYRASKEAEANRILLTPERLQLESVRALANNTKVFWGDKLPSLYADGASLLPTAGG